MTGVITRAGSSKPAKSRQTRVSRSKIHRVEKKAGQAGPSTVPMPLSPEQLSQEISGHLRHLREDLAKIGLYPVVRFLNIDQAQPKERRT